MKQYSLALALSLLVGLCMFLLSRHLAEQEETRRASELKNVNLAANAQLKAAIEQYVVIASGIRSYIHQTGKVPDPRELQEFVNRLTSGFNFQDSLVISSLDTTHTFNFVINPNQIDPHGLAGSSVPQRKSPSALARLNAILTDTTLQISDPVNLIEGWMGISVSFRVAFKDKPFGYIMAIFGLHNALSDIYHEGLAQQFVHRFRTESGHDFDRTGIRDGSRIYHDRKDSLFYGNFGVDPSDFIYSPLELYNLKLAVGTAYRQEGKISNTFTFLIAAGYLVFLVALFWITRQSVKYRQLNLVLTSTKEQVEKKNENLHQLNATKNRLFSIIAHDLKSPLGSIQTLLELKERQLIDEEETEEFLYNLRSSTERTQDLLDNLLKWAMVNSDQVQISKEPVDVTLLVNETIQLCQQMAANKGISIVKDLKAGLKVTADKNMVFTILRNLLSNAIKFSELGTEVVIATRSQSDRVLISVSDKGVGMSQEKVADLFQLHKQSVSKGTGGESGSGLGLILCKEFAERNRGSIDVQSSPGKGSTFTLNLPYAH